MSTTDVSPTVRLRAFVYRGEPIGHDHAYHVLRGELPAELSENERLSDTVDFAVTFGVAFALHRQDDAWADDQDVAQRALADTKDVWRAYSHTAPWA